MVKLQAAMLTAQTLDELYSLIEDYSYLEFIQIYNQLTPEQQAKLNAIDERDSKVQLVVTDTAKASSVETRRFCLCSNARN
jgi:hypothetical protein